MSLRHSAHFAIVRHHGNAFHKSDRECFEILAGKVQPLTVRIRNQEAKSVERLRARVPVQFISLRLAILPMLRIPHPLELVAKPRARVVFIVQFGQHVERVLGSFSKQLIQQWPDRRRETEIRVAVEQDILNLLAHARSSPDKAFASARETPSTR